MPSSRPRNPKDNKAMQKAKKIAEELKKLKTSSDESLLSIRMKRSLLLHGYKVEDIDEIDRILHSSVIDQDRLRVLQQEKTDLDSNKVTMPPPFEPNITKWPSTSDLDVMSVESRTQWKEFLEQERAFLKRYAETIKVQLEILAKMDQLELERQEEEGE